jgi:hypothetical protein
MVFLSFFTIFFNSLLITHPPIAILFFHEKYKGGGTHLIYLLSFVHLLPSLFNFN